MKTLRHSKIKEIVERYVIETQEDLADALSKQGIDITQATVSRDIKELMLIKVPTGDGRYRYAFPPEQNIVLSQARMERTFHDSIVTIDYSQNIVVLRTLPGTAQAVAYTIDYVKWPEIIGTVAGDDTIFVLVKPVEAVPQVIAKFQSLMGRGM
ncbi:MULTISPECIES: arginine repressor [Sporomusa]|uniref:Arginine repressor n=2 Tax=Sporomusa TaxID=2375 RepID=A0ABM9W6M9_9FIRM|nr:MULTISPECIES: arginine repressor [Sporomusa]MCM0757203.1 arginine repressor [Sporomusa sphaeroides DSM 2875]OLS58514.1 arginine repressor [Sporomusa sphaeroides DSM 2875]CVK19654.1 Arginine repressor [Sporomusa sphaeroides DSM 2875]SCM80123.1 Arginine repressor [uncultured Sporomusa sp.]HML34339.1 arginine repressor [Sporomusa sphaeroides]